MNAGNTNQQRVREKRKQTRNKSQPKGQDIMQADAEGAGSDATEFAEGRSDSNLSAQSNADESPDSESTIGIP